MTGVLNLRGVLQGPTKQGTRFVYKPFCAPVLFHDIFAGSECRREVRATARLSSQHGVQESVRSVLEVIDQYVFSCGIEQDNTVSVPSYADHLLSHTSPCSNSGLASGPEAV